MKDYLVTFTELEEVIALKNIHRILPDEFSKLCDEAEGTFNAIKLDARLKELEDKVDSINVKDVRRKLIFGTFMFFLVCLVYLLFIFCYKLVIARLPILQLNSTILVILNIFIIIGILICLYSFVVVHINTLWTRWKSVLDLQFRKDERQKHRNLDLMGIIQNKYRSART